MEIILSFISGVVAVGAWAVYLAAKNLWAVKGKCEEGYQAALNEINYRAKQAFEAQVLVESEKRKLAEAKAEFLNKQVAEQAAKVKELQEKSNRDMMRHALPFYVKDDRKEAQVEREALDDTASLPELYDTIEGLGR